MKSYQAYIIDLDGTMYLGDEEIPQAAPFIQRLREAGKKILFLTNNSTRRPEDVVGKLNSFGIEANLDEVYTSSFATLDYLRSKGYQKIYLIGEGGVKDALSVDDIDIVKEGAEAVVVGLDRSACYEDMKQAAFLIQDGAELVVTNSDSGLPTGEGLIPSTGAFAAFLERATGVDATYIGKPEAAMMDNAVKRLGVDKDEVLMVGDNYETDILAGINNGIDSLMVFTGLTSREEMEGVDKQPTYKVDTLDDWDVC